MFKYVVKKIIYKITVGLPFYKSTLSCFKPSATTLVVYK